MKLNSGLNRLILILNIFPALCLVLVCVIAYYPIVSLPLLDVLGLITPILIVVNLFFLLYWGFVKRSYILVPLLPLLLGFLSFGSIFQFNAQSDKTLDRGISILTYNVESFNYYKGKKVSDSVSIEIMTFIKKQDPDIICFQEFTRIKARQLKKYPYQYLTPYFKGKTTQGIFSKYLIIGQGSLDFPNSGNNSLYIDVVYKKDTLRVYNIHLQSYQVTSFRSLLKKQGGINFLKRLQYTASKLREQARILQAHREKSPYPSILCGDFNQTPFSPAFKMLNSGMKDSFREKGLGWGISFIRGIIHARIDFILADSEAFEILEHQNFKLRASDHLPVMARIDLRSD